MFTGIIQSNEIIIDIRRKKNFQTNYVKFSVQSLLSNLSIGASVSNNGCCLTVVDIKNDIVSFDIIEETLKITNLGSLKIGDFVNIERAAKLNMEIGGHIMSGHIDCVAVIEKIFISENNYKILFNLANKKIKKYLFYKGYIGIDGISLTLGKILNEKFFVHLIPESLKRTSLKKKNIGDSVNIEIDSNTKIIVDTTERILSKKKY